MTTLRATLRNSDVAAVTAAAQALRTEYLPADDIAPADLLRMAVRLAAGHTLEEACAREYLYVWSRRIAAPRMDGNHALLGPECLFGL